MKAATPEKTGAFGSSESWEHIITIIIITTIGLQKMSSSENKKMAASYCVN